MGKARPRLKLRSGGQAVGRLQRLVQTAQRHSRLRNWRRGTFIRSKGATLSARYGSTEYLGIREGRLYRAHHRSVSID